MPVEEIQIKKSEVKAALIKMEEYLFNGRNNEGSYSLMVPLRITSVFAAAYYANYFPPEAKVLRLAYTLLLDKGYYYNVEE